MILPRNRRHENLYLFYDFLLSVPLFRKPERAGKIILWKIVVVFLVKTSSFHIFRCVSKRQVVAAFGWKPYILDVVRLFCSQ